MPMTKRLLTAEAGQSMVLFVLVFVFLCAFVGLAVDYGAISAEKARLQGAADAAALAGALALPDAAAARSTASDYAGHNGVAPAGTRVTYPYNGDATRIEVVCTSSVSYSFARVFGFSSANVTARAVAERTGMSSGPFAYALFSGSTSDTLTFNGSMLNVVGDAHTNYRFSINGSNQTIIGSAEALSSFSSNGSNLTISGTCQAATISINGSNINIGSRVYSAAEVIDMPDFSDAIRAEAQAAGQVYTGNKTYNGSSISVDSPIYVQGNLTINGSRFSGQGIIFATGSITFNGSNLRNSSGDTVCFYSQNGNITVNGSNAELDGIVYAPNGTINMNGSNQTIHGRVVGHSITFNGSNISILSGTDDLDCLPQMTLRARRVTAVTRISPPPPPVLRRLFVA